MTIVGGVQEHHHRGGVSLIVSTQGEVSGTEHCCAAQDKLYTSSLTPVVDNTGEDELLFSYVLTSPWSSHISPPSATCRCEALPSALE